MKKKYYIFITAIIMFTAGGSLSAQVLSDTVWSFSCNSGFIPELSNEFLKYKGGLELVSDSKMKTGGFSALSVLDSGNRILAISDFSAKSFFPDSLRASWYEFEPVYDDQMNLTGMKYIKNGQILTENNEPLAEIESVAVVNNIGHISLDNGAGKGDYIYQIDLSAEKPDGDFIILDKRTRIPNYPQYSRQGIESMTMTDDGYLFLIHEKEPNFQYRYTWLINPETLDFKEKLYTSKFGEIKGITTLMSGDLIILEKHFHSGITKIDISLLPKTDLEHDTLQSTTLLSTESRCLDNFEGISSFIRNNKEYIMLITDNNGDWQKPGRQKTIIVLFEIL